MEQQNNAVRKRLENIWKSPDFVSFFKKNANRPAYMLKKGTLLFNEGEPIGKLYCVVEGFVKFYRLSEEGRETTTYLFGPGNVLGVRALTSEDEATKHTAVAITDMKVFTMSRSEYLDAVCKNPEHLLDLAYIFIERLNYTERKLEGFIATDTIARIANFLLDIARRFGLKKNGTVELPMEFTHQLIAELVGAFRETISVAMNALEKEKIIKVQKGKITILNPQKMLEYSLSKHKKVIRS